MRAAVQPALLGVEDRALPRLGRLLRRVVDVQPHHGQRLAHPRDRVQGQRGQRREKVRVRRGLQEGLRERDHRQDCQGALFWGGSVGQHISLLCEKGI